MWSEALRKHIAEYLELTAWAGKTSFLEQDLPDCHLAIFVMPVYQRGTEDVAGAFLAIQCTPYPGAPEAPVTFDPSNREVRAFNRALLCRIDVDGATI